MENNYLEMRTILENATNNTLNVYTSLKPFSCPLIYTFECLLLLFLQNLCNITTRWCSESVLVAGSDTDTVLRRPSVITVTTISWLLN